MSKELIELEMKITQLKKELIKTADANGLNSHYTITYSQELDELITMYQKLTYKRLQSNRSKSSL